MGRGRSELQLRDGRSSEAGGIGRGTFRGALARVGAYGTRDQDRAPPESGERQGADRARAGLPEPPAAGRTSGGVRVSAWQMSEELSDGRVEEEFEHRAGREG